jgi:hypothetical protein
MAPPPVPKKRKVRLPENGELACKILEKHRSMMAEQPGGLSEHQGKALSTAYRGVCLAELPFRTPSDMSRIRYAFLHLSTVLVRNGTRFWAILGREL